MKKIIFLALCAALLLTGCTAYEVTPGPQTMPAVEKSSLPVSGPVQRRYFANELVTPTDPQAWADEKINQYLNGRGARTFNAFEGWNPQRGTLSWNSPEPGSLVITLKNAYWINLQESHSYAQAVMSGVGYESPELKLVTVKTKDGAHSVSIQREDVPGLH